MEKDTVKKLQANSYLADGNIAYIEDLYDAYLKDANSVSDYWCEQFQQLAATEGVAGTDTPLSDIRNYFYKLPRGNGMAATTMAHPDLVQQQKQVRLMELINAYRTHGHHQAKLDPLNLAVRKSVPDLLLSHHGFSEADFTNNFPGIKIGASDSSLGGIYQALQRTYCDNLGIEYMHITNEAETSWIQQRLEQVQSHPQFSKDQKLRIYRHLTAAEGLEKYLGAKYVGQKRFSLEGGATLIPMLDSMVQQAGSDGVKELIIGMAHRGRLNVLVNVLGKSPERLFREFEGKPHDITHSGDVKYHMGFSSNVNTPGGVIHLALAFNPSHLEIIDPVVEGSVRARQERRNDLNRDQVVPILIHGDAAVAGQGVVAETFNFSQARGFNTGGSIHIVINNQVGFTTSNPLDSRSSLYCTDVAKMVQAPVFHVNGDDVEACVYAMELALAYRMQFKKDVMIDFVCYRRHGHNEADEPSGTQPIMYRQIKSQPRTREIYAEQLVKEGVLTEQQAIGETTRYRDALDAGRTVVELMPKEKDDPNRTDWTIYKGKKWDQKVDTKMDKKRLQQLGKAVTSIPEGFKLQAQVKREYEMRRKMSAGEMPLNWGFAETMAYASLVTQGFRVRLCGQDTGRGTFSHRHSVLHNYENGELYIPLQHIAKDQSPIAIIDSVLSEESVLGFEYGYATTEADTCVIWEAQFGDFANGAQVVIDQFISSGEQKWDRLCGLVMLLPHGYEGQGPEHSSARLERYLQMCAENNFQVCVPTTPAQMFHMLRRQMLRTYRKPLVVMTPKSLLRHKLATSSLDDLSKGQFQCVIPEVDDIKANKVRRVVLCSGKVYYDLLQQRRHKEIDDIVIIRIEQLYPFPEAELKAALKPYAKVKDIIWCQEEPKNQGAWYSSQHHIIACLDNAQQLNYVGRKASASPATGHTSLHLQQQIALVEESLKK